MRISVIQQLMGIGYGYLSEEYPSLEVLRERADERMNTCERLIREAAEEGTDLAVTVETVNALTALGDTRYEYRELFGGEESEDVKRFSSLARELGIYIVAGLILTMDGEAYNCAVLFGKQGEIVGIHKKVHLPAGEEKHVKAGDRYEVFPTEHGNIGMLVCWDLQYPEAARELALGGADLICCPTMGWENIYGLCRAYENSVSIAAAMVSYRASGPTLCNPSCIVDNMGSVVAMAEEGATCYLTAELDIKKEPSLQYNSGLFYPSHSMRKTRLTQRRPDTYTLADKPLCDTPLYKRYFEEGKEGD